VSNKDWEKGRKKREKEQAAFAKILEKERKVEEKKLRDGLNERLRVAEEEWDTKMAAVQAGTQKAWTLGAKPPSNEFARTVQQEVDNLLISQASVYGDW